MNAAAKEAVSRALNAAANAAPALKQEDVVDTLRQLLAREPRPSGSSLSVFEDEATSAVEGCALFAEADVIVAPHGAISACERCECQSVSQSHHSSASDIQNSAF